MSKVRLSKRGVVDTASPKEVCIHASGLEESMCPTVYVVTNVVYKCAKARLYKLLTKLDSSMLIQGCLPNSLSTIEITPILKSSLKDSATSM